MSSSGVAGDRLRSFVERIERLEEEIKALSDDKKDIYAEAKGEGFDVKILREVVRLRKQDEKERDEHNSLLNIYMHALERRRGHLWPMRHRAEPEHRRARRRDEPAPWCARRPESVMESRSAGQIDSCR